MKGNLMNRNTRHVLLMVIALLLMLALALTTQAQQGNPPPPDPNGGQQQPPPPPNSGQNGGQGGQNGGTGFNIAQALSPEAQRKTIAFSALAFLTGDFNADTFFPPGKVADVWGFQYLRDNDPSGMGHNTDFLTYASLNMLNVLTADQRAALQVLAESQVDTINQYAIMRFTLIDAFRRNLEGDIPAGTTGLNMQAVQAYSAQLYRLDGEITLERAKVMSSILNALTSDQKAYLDSMVGVGMTSWNQPQEPEDLRGLGHDVKVNVMTYAGDLFSWYAGSVEADTYINPERQGTYFGAFYMKDAPAVGNPGYTISSSLTSDMGQAFLQSLTSEQSALIEDVVNSELPYLQDIVTTRSAISTELRRSLEGGTINDETVLNLMDAYGQQDGAVVYFFAKDFALINATLTDAQKAQLMAMRQQMLGGLTADKPFMYSQAIDMPAVPNTDFLFS
jgi:Spy/CpxP family protein refolding chaperone